MSEEGYFLVRSHSISEREYSDSRITYGSPMDILADAIEKKDFFGWYCSESPDNVNDSGNAKIHLYLMEMYLIQM